MISFTRLGLTFICIVIASTACTAKLDSPGEIPSSVEVPIVGGNESTRPPLIERYTFPTVTEPWGALGRPMTHWGKLDAAEPLESPASSRFGGTILLAKNVLPNGEVIISRSELTELCELQKGGSTLRGVGEGRRVPAHWDAFPPLVQDLEFEPPLSLLSIRGGHKEVIRLSRLEGHSFYTFYPEIREVNMGAKVVEADLIIPIRYVAGWPSAAPEFVVFIGGPGDEAEQIAKTAQLTITIEQESLPGLERTTTIQRLDLDGDGSPEILRYHDRDQTRNCEEGDAYCDESRTVILMRSGGRWYATGVAQSSQDGVIGW